jgi:hypothetical protein
MIMNQKNVMLVASWRMVNGQLSRGWQAVAIMDWTSDAAMMSEFNAEVSTWLAGYDANSRVI